MTRNVLVTIPNVLAISDGLVLVCERKGRRFRVPVTNIAPESQVRFPADYGNLVIPRWLAENLGLMDSASG
jgi:hypothetical protein